MQLSEKVIAQIQRLGGEIPQQNKDGSFGVKDPEAEFLAHIYESIGAMVDGKIKGLPVPPPMQEFSSVIWPNQKYESSESSECWVWMFEFNSLQWLADIPLQDRGDRALASFGLADGGNYFLILDLGDPHPADPQVYKVDHYDPDQMLEAGIPLSRFLGELNRENSTAG
jgi:hypothetical protein